MNDVSQIPSKLMWQERELPKHKNTLGKDDFMKLLMSQLQHQDPLKPMDHQEFATQLAQFGQLEQLTNIGSGIAGLKNGMGDDAKLQAIGMIGKRVEAIGSEIELIQGETVALGASLPEGYQVTEATITDPNGKLLRKISTIENSGESKKEILWDGKDHEGVPLPSGKYLFRVQGVGPNGNTMEAGSEISGRVVGVEMEGQTPTLVVQSTAGQSKIALGKVKRILIDGETPKAAESVQKPKVEKTQKPTPDEMKLALGNVVQGNNADTEADSWPEPLRNPHAIFDSDMIGAFRR